MISLGVVRPSAKAAFVGDKLRERMSFQRSVLVQGDPLIQTVAG